MNHRTWLLATLFVLLWATPAEADSRVIVRSTLGLQGLQNLLAVQQLCGLPLLQQSCSVLPLGDPLNQVFLITTPLDPAIVLSLLRPLPGIVDAELDQLLSLLGGLNQAPSPPPAGLMSDRTPVPYFGTMVWNSYANQPAATIVHIQTAQNQFNVSGVGGVVADIDTGVDPSHPALAPVLLQGYDFIHNQQGASELSDLSPTDFPSPHPPCTPSTCQQSGQVNQSSVAVLDQSSVAVLDTNPKYAAFGHGTMVMGVIHLVAPKANLLPLKAFSSDGTGFLSDILHAIYYAVQNKANVINMSFDFPTSSAELAAALDSANQSALICASSAGNNGQKADPSTGSGMVYPAALQSVVMGVASTSDLDTRSSFSNYGDAIVWVAAPGEGIVTTYPFSTYAAGWGTSFSAPFVSGTSALLLNKQAKTNESQAAAAVAAHAVPVGPDMGNGRLDVFQALQALSPQDFSLSPAPTTSTINAGQPATYTLTVMPSGGFNQTVTLGCSGFPPASTCVITPPAVTLDGTNPTTATVVVQTMVRSITPPAIPVRIVPLPLVGLSWLLVCVAWLLYMTLPGFRQSSRQHPGLAAAVGLLAVLLCSYSCGGGGSYTSTPTQTPQSSATPSSLTLNPTSVNGGNSSTGKVTLNGPAPSGGTVVALSSGNTSAATVPPSVTVAPGATSAAFQITTVASANSTPVTISASSGSLTQTASLTVTPQPPPGPTLTSLSLKPTNVVGGSPSSGTVTLSAPAPSGGALVSLSSSNTGVVTVPSNVTIPAGATSAIFTASSSSVTVPTPVTVSASYAGVTQTASLTVTPTPPPGTPAGTYTLTITGTSGTLSHNTTAKLVVN